MRHRSLPIAWHLGLGATLLVAVLLGPVSFVAVRSDLERERAYRAELFQASAGLLREALGRADSQAAVQGELSRFEAVHARQGDVVRAELRLADGAGVVEVGPPESAWRDETFDVFQWPVTTSLTGPEPASLVVYRAQPEFEQVVRNHLWGWATALALLSLAGLGSLLFVSHFVVARPLKRLLNGIRQVGRGYPGALSDFRSGREWHQVATGVRALAGELERTMEALVVAERRAREAGVEDLALVAEPHVEPVVARPRPLWKTLSLRALRVQAKRLGQAEPQDQEARTLARALLDGGALEAERLGDVDLRRHLEDGAFRLLYPREHAATTALVDSQVAHPPSWIREREAEIRRVLDDSRVPVVTVTWRVKNPAGVWKKAHKLGVPIEQIRDVFGLRVVTPTEDTCYRALQALQQRYTSQLLSFKDYIARPKPNGYRSLHATLRDGEGPWFEVQIRTPEMHARAEGGEAAHWRYKGAAAPAA